MGLDVSDVGITARNLLCMFVLKPLGIMVGLIWTNAVLSLMVTERTWSWTGINTLTFLTQSDPVLMKPLAQDVQSFALIQVPHFSAHIIHPVLERNWPLGQALVGLQVLPSNTVPSLQLVQELAFPEHSLQAVEHIWHLFIDASKYWPAEHICEFIIQTVPFCVKPVGHVATQASGVLSDGQEE